MASMIDSFPSTILLPGLVMRHFHETSVAYGCALPWPDFTSLGLFPIRGRQVVKRWRRGRCGWSARKGARMDHGVLEMAIIFSTAEEQATGAA